MMRIWKRRRDEDRPVDVVSVAEFNAVLEKRALKMLDMDLHEFRVRAAEGDLPESPAVDHLRFLLGV